MDMVLEHWFWALMTATAVVWYATITVYVAIRAMVDIRQMLAHLQERQERHKEP